MIACGLSLKHRAKFGRLKSMSGIKVLSGKGVFGLSKQDMGVPSSAQQGSGLKKDLGLEISRLGERSNLDSKRLT